MYYVTWNGNISGFRGPFLRVQPSMSSHSDSSSSAASHGPHESPNISQDDRKEHGGVCSQDKSGRHPTTINMLPDDVLLDIFDFHIIEFYPRTQDRLMHVCRRWRQVIFASPFRLQIRLHCTPGDPVRKILGFLPAIPIHVDYCIYDNLAPDDEDNVLAALEHPNRVCYLCLSNVTTPQLAKLVTVMRQPFPLLTSLELSLEPSLDAPVLPDRFLGGSAPCLQELQLKAVPFPELPTLLLSSHDLVILRLGRIPPAGYVSPEAMVACLAALPKLDDLFIGFHEVVFLPDRMGPPPITRTVIPALRSFEFYGISNYLEDLVVRIDCPQLKRTEIKYSHEYVDFQVTQLFKFINRSEDFALTLFSLVDASFVFGSIAFQFFHDFRIMISITFVGMTWDVSHLLRVFNRLSHKLSHSRYLCIALWSQTPSWEDETGRSDWVQLLRPFTAVRTLRLLGSSSRFVTLALEYSAREMVAELLPALESLCLEYQPASSVAEFVAARQLSGRPVTIEDRSPRNGSSRTREIPVPIA
ncbi:hypothetical protein EDB89DRAFT_112347 [Lactarius sanguifluus]|nr:hypothetical protein EDB89DRAFT_112347 [Lactarius sanguifluus]